MQKIFYAMALIFSFFISDSSWASNTRPYCLTVAGTLIPKNGDPCILGVELNLTVSDSPIEANFFAIFGKNGAVEKSTLIDGHPWIVTVIEDSNHRYHLKTLPDAHIEGAVTECEGHPEGSTQENNATNSKEVFPENIDFTNNVGNDTDLVNFSLKNAVNGVITNRFVLSCHVL